MGARGPQDGVPGSENAGCIPPELELRNEIATMKDLIRALDDSPARTSKLRELNFRIIEAEHDAPAPALS